MRYEQAVRRSFVATNGYFLPGIILGIIILNVCYVNGNLPETTTTTTIMGAGTSIGTAATSNHRQATMGLSEMMIPPMGYSRDFLARRTLHRILNQTVTIDDISIVPPCKTTRTLVESTSSLLLLTALTKETNMTHYHRNSLWRYIQGVIVGSSSRGLLPRYTYPVESHSKEDFFVGRLPNWPLFVKENPCQRNETRCWVGSGRISGLPFHGTVLLELLLRLQREAREGSERLTKHELYQLQSSWERIFEHHDYLHNAVMRGCKNYTAVPCYNILHPWESLLEQSSSPSWREAMKPTLDRMATSNWTLNYDIPKAIQDSHGYNEEVFKGMLFLNECLVNTTASTVDLDDVQRENRFLKMCQFAMLDVGYASALAQADRDLQTVGMWLSAQNEVAHTVTSYSISWASALDRLEQWNEQNDYVMQLLWHSAEHSFQSLYAIPPSSIEGERAYPSMSYISDPTANNLMVFWQNWESQKSGMEGNIQEMSLQLLSHSGEQSFDCGNSYPLWASGCNSTFPEIDPRYNYFVGLGLSRNKEKYSPFGQYLTNATIKLICSGESIQDENPIEGICSPNMTNFQEAYSGLNYSLNLDECGTTSTSTASILVQLLWDDFDFTSESPLPPIRNSWVITLITAELMIAFAVGLSCVQLSLTIVRRENNENSVFREDPVSVSPLIPDYAGRNVDDDADDDIMSTSYT